MKIVNYFILFLLLISFFLFSSCDSPDENANHFAPQDNSVTSEEIEADSDTDQNSSDPSEDPSANQNNTHSDSVPGKTIGGILYYKDGDASYDLSGVSINDSSSIIGIESLGEIKIKGDVNEAQINGINGYFADDDSVSIDFNRTLFSNIVGSDGYEYSICNDQTENIMGYTIGAVQECGVIILKSYDNGASWVYNNASFVNVNNTISYFPNGEDILKGTIIRIVVGMKLSTQKVVGQKKDWKNPFYYKWVDVYDTFYITLIQENTFYIGTNIINAGFYSSEVEYHVEKENEFESEIVNKSSSLTNGSVTFDKITYSNNSNNSLSTTCSYNEQEPFVVTNYQTFTSVGKYHFVVSNPIGNTKEFTIFLLDKDTLFEDYFGDSYISQEKRVFDAESPYPVFMVGTKIGASETKDYLPPISGSIFVANGGQFSETPYRTLSSEEAVSQIEITEPNLYCVKLLIGEESSSGQKVSYSFFFKIVNSPDYQPTVNYNLIHSSDRILNMSSKAYAVNFETTQGGSYVFLFPCSGKGYEQAESFALEIEKRFIESHNDTSGKYYYYRGKRFDSKVELYGAMVDRISDSVYLTYINPLETYAIEIVDENKLDRIETQLLENDVRVCLNNEIKNELLSKDTIINNYIFTQVAPFESGSVSAIDEFGVEFSIPFDISVNEVLPHTGCYTIKETNWCNTRTYQVFYIKPTEITGTVSLSLYDENDELTTQIIDSSNSGITLAAKRAVINKSADVNDSQTVIVCSALGYRQISLLSEADSYIYELTEQGTYTVEIINRMGYSYQFSIEISGTYVPDPFENTDFID